LPAPFVHPDLAPLAALSATDEERAAATIEICLVECKGLADPKPRSPHHDDGASESQAVRAIAGCTHHPDDLLDAGPDRPDSADLCSWVPSLRGEALQQNAELKLTVA
jgi:hypothetical protein